MSARTMCFALALAASAAIPFAATPAATGHKAQAAAIGIKKAREIALKARPGKVIDEMDNRDYEFTISANGISYEVDIDVTTGAVTQNAPLG